MGKTVRIQAGQWKGYLGTVSHTTATHVQVELHSRLKKVMVVKERVHVIGDKFGATDNGDDNNGVSGVTTPAFVGGMTPMHGGATPMHGGATPMHGGATPMHDGYGCEALYDFFKPCAPLFNIRSQINCDFGDSILVVRPQAMTTFGGQVGRLTEKTKAGIKSKTMMDGALQMGNLTMYKTIPLEILLGKIMEVSSFV